MTAPVQVGRPSRSAHQAPPTIDQMMILVARAERKGGLDYVEGDRLREGLLSLATAAATPPPPPPVVDNQALVELRRKHRTKQRRVQQRARRWEKRARQAGGLDVDGGRPECQQTRQASSREGEEAREALVRVTNLAARWTHVPAKRQAGAAVLAVISNRDLP